MEGYRRALAKRGLPVSPGYNCGRRLSGSHRARGHAQIAAHQTRAGWRLLLQRSGCHRGDARYFRGWTQSADDIAVVGRGQCSLF